MKGGEKMKRKKTLLTAFSILSLVVLTGIAVAAFGDKGEILGSTFTVGSADIKLLKDTFGDTSSNNLADEIDGPSFSNIGPNWTQDYVVKIYNNASTPIELTSNADYETANDPDDLRQLIFVEMFKYNDADNDGEHDVGELSPSLGKKTIVKWKTEGFSIGTVNPGAVQGALLRFSTDSVSDTKQGASAIFDFEFDSLGIE